MHVQVRTKLKQPKSELMQLEPDTFIARVTSPPENNKANLEIAALIAKHYKVPKSSVHLIRGATSKNKTFEF